MANFNIKNPILFFFFFFILVSLLLPFISSLSTVSISQLSNSNQTLICSLIIQSSVSPQHPYLNCTSFSPQGRIQIPLTPFAEKSYSFISVVGGDDFVCALSSSYTSSFIVCWRFLDNNGTNMTYKRIYLGQVIDELVAGNSHICGLINGSPLQCWQWPEFFNPPNLMITTSLAVGENFLCGLAELGQIECLPKESIVSDNVPVGNYSLVAAGFRHACAISVNGSLECWGKSNIMSGGFKKSGKFTSLALGENRSCGMRTNGAVVCWGENNFNLPVSLHQESFFSLIAKRDVFCGVLTSNFSLYCWGNDFLDSNSPVFNNVVPGPCRKTCPCHPLPNYADYCSQGLMICEPCIITETTTSPNQPLPWLPTSGPTSSSNGGKWNKKMVAFLVVGCFGSLLFVVVLSFLFYKYCKVRRYRVHDSGPLEKGIIVAPPQGTKQSRPVLEKRLSQLLSLGQGGKLVEFSIDFLLQATNNFSQEQKIGTGSFGSVYRAILPDGTEVAIKRAEMSAACCNTYPGSTKRNQEEKDSAFVNELELLSCLNHRNLVRLLGYGKESDERVLVYEYMDNGTLHDHLHKLQDSPLLSWSARIKVALDTARGIEYLHEYAMPPIIHRDIKSSNILLDATWNARVSDFGLSLLRPADDESLITLHAAGTVGYMDPEYYRSQQLTTKSDVYSFGVVLLELISGCKAIHKNENGIPRNVVDYVVPYIVQDEIHRVLDRRVAPPTPFEIEAVTYVGYLAADCVTLEGIDRPTMSDIVNSLERALTACLAPTTLSNSSTASSS